MLFSRKPKSILSKVLSVYLSTLNFFLHTGLGIGTYWRALEVGEMRGRTMCVDAGKADRNSKESTLWCSNMLEKYPD